MNKKLVNAYKKMIENKTQSKGFRQKDYDEYLVEAKKYLKKDFDDGIERGKLLIKLYRHVNNKK